MPKSNKKKSTPPVAFLCSCIESSALGVKTRSKAEHSPHFFHQKLSALCSLLRDGNGGKGGSAGRDGKEEENFNTFIEEANASHSVVMIKNEETTTI